MEKNTIIDYYGPVQYETVGELIHELKKKSQTLGIQTGTYKKILLVMIESLENIIKYNEYPAAINGNANRTHPSIRIEKDQKTYTITSSNLLNNTHIPIIKNKIRYLNTLDQQGLKEYYKSIITNGEFSQKGGAGLGLIEMAKISGHQIDFDFASVDQDYSWYKLQVVIDN
ncbi:MAG: SiaB family protein kinase [Bacteroidales bacterium]|nr:SiaB family protein kinase [Bacteroidales bacterium]